MKRLLIFSFLLALVIPAFSQQVTPETLIKRQKRKGLTIKEWNMHRMARNHVWSANTSTRLTRHRKCFVRLNITTATR